MREEGDDPVEWVRPGSETGRALCGREASGGLRGRWALASGVRREGGGDAVASGLSGDLGRGERSGGGELGRPG